MFRHRSLSAVIAVSLAILLAVPHAHAQDPDEPSEDPGFDERVDEMWNAVQEAEDAEEREALQREFAREAFAYFTENPGTETGIEAGGTAFMMWGNIGADEAVDEALPQIDRDSPVWARAIPAITGAYHRADREDDIGELMEELATELTDPDSRATALRMLGDDHRRASEYDAARPYYEDILELEAEDHLHRHAEKALQEIENLRVGQRAPGFTAETLDGEELALEELRGRVVLLSFWGTGCGWSVRELPYLAEAYERYRDEGFEIVGIAMDQDRERLEETLAEHGVEWPQIKEPERWDGELIRRYGVLETPDTYLIGPDGEILAKNLREDGVMEAVSEALEAGL